MTYEELLAYCLAKPGAWKDSPWEDHVVAKVGDKIFAYLGDDPPGATLKCELLEAEALRGTYPSITAPEKYLNKNTYNVVPLDGSVPDDVVRSMVDTSYALVAAKLTRAQKRAIEQQVD